MPQFQLPVSWNLPFSGNVQQSILPWTLLFNPVGSQVGLFNINLGQSSDPGVEEEILSDVAGYGKQLGRIEDALLVLLNRLDVNSLSPEDRKAVDDLRTMTSEIEKVKKRPFAKSIAA